MAFLPQQINNKSHVASKEIDFKANSQEARKYQCSDVLGVAPLVCHDLTGQRRRKDGVHAHCKEPA